MRGNGDCFHDRAQSTSNIAIAGAKTPQSAKIELEYTVVEPRLPSQAYNVGDAIAFESSKQGIDLIILIDGFGKPYSWRIVYSVYVVVRVSDMRGR